MVSGEMCRMLRFFGIERVVMLIDDLLVAGASAQRVAESLYVARSMFAALGLEVADDKFEGPSTSLEFVGIVIDDARELMIGADRLWLAAEWIADVVGAGACSHSALATWLGRISWYAIILVGCRTFMRRMWNLLNTEPFGFAGSMVITDGFRADAAFFLLRTGVAAAPLGGISRVAASTWMGSRIWLAVDAPDLVWVKSDAAGSGRWCFLCDRADGSGSLVFGQLAGSDLGELDDDGNNHGRVPFFELAAVLEACCAFSFEWAGRTVSFGIDSTPMFNALNTMTSSNARVMRLLRAIVVLQYMYRFSVVAAHVTRDCNGAADWGTRCDPGVVQDFHPFLEAEGSDAKECAATVLPFRSSSPLQNVGTFLLRLGPRSPAGSR
jgi:hypothetical protein